MLKIPFNYEYFANHNPMLETRAGVPAEFIRLIPGCTKFPLVINSNNHQFRCMADGRSFDNEVRSASDIFMLVNDSPVQWLHMSQIKPDDMQLVVLMGNECVWQYYSKLKILRNLVIDLTIPEDAADCYLPLPIYNLKRINYAKKAFKP